MGFLFVIVLVALLTIPGHVILASMDNKFITGSAKPVLVVALSYTVFALSLSIFTALSLSVDAFVGWLVFYMAGASIGSLIVIMSSATKRSYRNSLTFRTIVLSPSVLIALSVLAYLWVFGPYHEIPADFYSHLIYFQQSLDTQLLGSFDYAQAQGGNYARKLKVWYHLIALAARVSQLAPVDVMFYTSWVSKSLFLISVYCSCVVIFSGGRGQSPAEQRTIAFIAATTCVFVFIHMGVSVFAYIRYYSFAPAMLNMANYFACICLFVELLRSPRSDGNFARSGMLVIILIGATLVHMQEAMFALLMLIAMLLIASLRQHDPNLDQREMRLLRTLAIVACAFIVVIYIFARINLNVAPNIGWRLWDFGPAPGILPDLKVLNLRYQGIQVFTLWGVFVYLLFLLHWSRYRNNLFILAGMVLPLLTILNPFFVDLFLRLNHSTTLYRICFIVPIHFVAADLLIHYLKTLITWPNSIGNTASTNNWLDTLQRYVSKVLVSVAVLLLFGLLLPIKNTWAGAHYSRVPTLVPVADGNSYYHLLDLIEYLSGLESRKRILTDPITGYVLTGLTKHHNHRAKFSRGRIYKNFTFENYDDAPLARYRGYLLVINQRTQAKSRVGKLSRHWNELELAMVSHYYPPQLIEHVRSNPSGFRLLWQAEDIFVYWVR